MNSDIAGLDDNASAAERVKLLGQMDDLLSQQKDSPNDVTIQHKITNLQARMKVLEDHIQGLYNRAAAESSPSGTR